MKATRYKMILSYLLKLAIFQTSAITRRCTLNKCARRSVSFVGRTNMQSHNKHFVSHGLSSKPINCDLYIACNLNIRERENPYYNYLFIYYLCFILFYFTHVYYRKCDQKSCCNALHFNIYSTPTKTSIEEYSHSMISRRKISQIYN